MKTILAVAAHPDDEALGCGATLALHADAGDEVHVLLLADGETSRPTANEVEVRRRAAEDAGDALGASSVTLLDLPDNRLDECALLDISQIVEESVSRLSPAVVYTHHGGDLNVDHRLAHQAVMTACRPVADSPVRQILTFEVLSSTEWASPYESNAFVPRLFVDVSSTFERKLEALRCYEREMRPFPHPRSVEAVRHLAGLRGSASGLVLAEAFDVMRIISRGLLDLGPVPNG